VLTLLLILMSTSCYINNAAFANVLWDDVLTAHHGEINGLRTTKGVGVCVLLQSVLSGRGTTINTIKKLSLTSFGFR